jgi:hypothetical protein
MLEMVNLHRPQVMVHMAYLKTGRIWEFKSKPKSIRAIPLPKTLLFWACTVAMACLGKCVALWCLWRFCLDRGVFDPNKLLHDFIRFGAISISWMYVVP